MDTSNGVTLVNIVHAFSSNGITCSMVGLHFILIGLKRKRCSRSSISRNYCNYFVWQRQWRTEVNTADIIACDIC